MDILCLGVSATRKKLAFFPCFYQTNGTLLPLKGSYIILLQFVYHRVDPISPLFNNTVGGSDPLRFTSGDKHLLDPPTPVDPPHDLVGLGLQKSKIHRFSLVKVGGGQLTPPMIWSEFRGVGGGQIDVYLLIVCPFNSPSSTRVCNT